MNGLYKTGAIYGCALMLGLVTCQTHAGLVYNQPWGNTLTGPFSQTLGNIPSNTQEIADNFTAQDSWTLNGVSWFGAYSDGPLPANSEVVFLVRVYSDAGGLPSEVPFFEQSVLPTYSSTTATATLFGYQFTAALPTQLALQSDVVYWISIQDDDPFTPNFNWNGNILGAGDNFASRQSGQWTLQTPNAWGMTDRAFSLYAVPLPPALWLFACCIASLISTSWRRQAPDLARC